VNEAARVYESDLSASSWRIASSALIPLAFQVRRSTWPGAARSDRRILPEPKCRQRWRDVEEATSLARIVTPMRYAEGESLLGALPARKLTYHPRFHLGVL
jgi:hypothetical protein